MRLGEERNAEHAGPGMRAHQRREGADEGLDVRDLRLQAREKLLGFVFAVGVRDAQVERPSCGRLLHLFHQAIDGARTRARAAELLDLAAAAREYRLDVQRGPRVVEE